MNRRGRIITDPQEVIDAIMAGRQLFNDCTIPTNGKWRRHKIGYIIDRVKEGKIFHVKGEEPDMPPVSLKDKITAFLQRDQARIADLEHEVESLQDSLLYVNIAPCPHCSHADEEVTRLRLQYDELLALYALEATKATQSPSPDRASVLQSEIDSLDDDLKGGFETWE